MIQIKVYRKSAALLFGSILDQKQNEMAAIVLFAGYGTFAMGINASLAHGLQELARMDFCTYKTLKTWVMVE